MRYTYTGKNINVFDDLKEKTERKLNRLQKLLPEDAEVFVSISKIRHLFKMEVSVPMHKRILRAEVTAGDPEGCLDQVADILEKQMVKYKGRLRQRSRRNVTTREEESFLLSEPPITEAEESGGLSWGEATIHKTKRFALKPMDAQEAVMEMELLGHNFFVFRNDTTDEVNVIYKRNDGTYGLIEPQ